MNELKAKYNKNLIRRTKAEIYLDGEAPAQEKNKWEPKFRELITEGNRLLHEIEKSGHKVLENEILHGFQDDP